MRELEYLEAKADEARRKIRGLEELKVASEVFDRSTLLSLYELVNKGVFEVLMGPIKTGKESHVLLAQKGRRYMAVKIHRIATSNYRNMLSYIEGDPRFRDIRKSRRGVIYTWVTKEYKNLGSAYEAGIAVPKPLAYKNNVLAMEFIGKGRRPYPMLKDAELDHPEGVFQAIVEATHGLYCRANLVHSDLSEYNVLMRGEEPVLIDLSHAVVREHPLAEEYLVRDVEHICKFFGKYFPTDANRILERVRSCEDGVRQDTHG